MLGLTRRSLAPVALSLFALAIAFDGVLVTASGSRAPAWSHWWCSPSAAAHAAPHSATNAGRLAAALVSPMSVLLPHWPHLLPVLVALATLTYLRRANRRYHAHETHGRRPRG